MHEKIGENRDLVIGDQRARSLGEQRQSPRAGTPWNTAPAGGRRFHRESGDVSGQQQVSWPLALLHLGEHSVDLPVAVAGSRSAGRR